MSLATINNKKIQFIGSFALGYNMRMPSLNAALGLAQMKKIRLLIKRKRDILINIINFLIKNNEFFSLYEENKSQKSNFWLQALVLKKKYRNKTKK